MKNLLFTLFTFLFFCGCSPQKRIARIAEKYNLKTLETIAFKDTIYIEKKEYTFLTQIDTSGNFYQENKGNEMAGTVKGDTIYVKFTTKPDTIYIEKPITIETLKVEKVEKKNGNLAGKIIGILFAFGFLYVLVVYLKQTNKQIDNK